MPTKGQSREPETDHAKASTQFLTKMQKQFDGGRSLFDKRSGQLDISRGLIREGESDIYLILGEEGRQ